MARIMELFVIINAACGIAPFLIAYEPGGVGMLAILAR